jgi:ATP-dependent Lhr-like helicase
MLPLSFDSALKVGEFRRRIHGLLASRGVRGAVSYLVEEYRMEPHAAREIVKYVWEQASYVGRIPSDKLVLVEFFRDNGSWSIVFHTLFGRRVNDALSRAFASALSRRTGYPVRITISDNGFLLATVHEPTRDLIESLFSDVRRDNLRGILEEVVSRTELMKRRFRHVAQRSFMILRRYKGREKDPERLQLNAQRLLDVLMETDRGHPVIKETFREILEDYMDIKNAARVLEWIEKGHVSVEVVGPLEYPSPFAHHLVARSYSDVVLMEDRRKLLQRLHESVLRALQGRGATSLHGEHEP